MKPFINLFVIFVVLIHLIELSAQSGRKEKSLSRDIYPRTHVIDGPLEPPGFERNLPENYIYLQPESAVRGSLRPVFTHHGSSSGSSDQGHNAVQPRSPSAFRPFSGNQQPHIRPGIPYHGEILPSAPAGTLPVEPFGTPSGNQQTFYRPIAHKPRPPAPGQQ